VVDRIHASYTEAEAYLEDLEVVQVARFDLVGLGAVVLVSSSVLSA
jgi:hypothetical protein